jgi:uncharacterized SAM-binding protein YcdF (DUF218 family)
VLDAIVVLGCRIGPDGRPGGALQRRIDRAARAYHAGQSPLLVVSGGKRWHDMAEADAMGAVLRAAGIPEGAIVAERRSRSTIENAVYTAELLQARAARHIGVVTCDWHMFRALASFRWAGLEAVPIPAVSPPVARPWAVLRALRERARWAVVRRLAARGRTG